MIINNINPMINKHQSQETTVSTLDLLSIVQASTRWQLRPHAEPEATTELATSNRDLCKILLEIHRAQDKGMAVA